MTDKSLEGWDPLEFGKFAHLVTEIQKNPDGPFPACPQCKEVPKMVETTRSERRLSPGARINEIHTVRFFPCGHIALHARSDSY